MFPVDTAVKVCGSICLKDSQYKIVHFTENETFLIEICNRPRKLFRVLNREIRIDADNQAIYKIKYSLPNQLYLPDEDLKEQWIEERERNKRTFMPIIKNINDFIEGNNAGLAVFKEVSNKSGLDKATIYAKTYKYLMYGRNMNAFLPGHFLKGGSGSFKKTTAETKIRGRPKERKKRHGTVNVGDKEKKWIIDAYNKYYKKQSANGEKCITLKQVCHALWHDHYLLDPDSKSEEDRYQHNRISEANFYYWIHKLIPDLEIVRRDVGKLAFEKDFNSLHGKSSDLVIAPGQIYFIDATPTDVYLASEFELIKTVSPGKLSS